MALKGSKLVCEKIDEHVLKISGLSRAAAKALAAAVFPAGAAGECGGLVQGGRVLGAGNKPWVVDEPTRMAPHEMGLHGRHGGALAAYPAIAEVQEALAALGTKTLEGFKPTSVRVAYEQLGGRRLGDTLCGWSAEPDFDASPKVRIHLGGTCTLGFKYSKRDTQSLDVTLASGDILVLSPVARKWVQAVKSIQPGGGDIPFDYLHVQLADYSRLPAEKVEKLMNPVPDPADFGYKWHQYTFHVLDEPGKPLCEVRPVPKPGEVRLTPAREATPAKTPEPAATPAKPFRPESRTNGDASGRWVKRGRSGPAVTDAAPESSGTASTEKRARRYWWTAKMLGDPQGCVGKCAEEHGVHGIVCKGRPGVIIMEGPEQNMAAFAASLRKLPWKKLRDIGMETEVNHAFNDLEILECADRKGDREGTKVDTATLSKRLFESKCGAATEKHVLGALAPEGGAMAAAR
jgi:hypothetical protein